MRGAVAASVRRSVESTLQWLVWSLLTLKRYTSGDGCQPPCATIAAMVNVAMAAIRRLRPEDLKELITVYHDAVISQAPGFYSQAQIAAWSEHARRDDGLRQSLGRGYGLVSCSGEDSGTIEAFALLDPPDRLALLYCRGRASRQGRATALMQVLENHARQQGCRRLRTEASQLSRPLLERRGWRIDAEEEVIFAGESFHRWRMIKDLA